MERFSVPRNKDHGTEISVPEGPGTEEGTEERGAAERRNHSVTDDSQSELTEPWFRRNGGRREERRTKGNQGTGGSPVPVNTGTGEPGTGRIKVKRVNRRVRRYRRTAVPAGRRYRKNQGKTCQPAVRRYQRNDGTTDSAIQTSVWLDSVPRNRAASTEKLSPAADLLTVTAGRTALADHPCRVICTRGPPGQSLGSLAAASTACGLASKRRVDETADSA